MQLRFKLVSSLLNSPVAPIAAIAAPEVNSASVSIIPGDLDSLRTINEEAEIYNDNSVVSGDTDYYHVPIKSSLPPQAADYSSSLEEDILIGPVEANVVWEVKNIAGTLIKCNNEYLSIVDLKTNQILPASVQYSSDGSTWSADSSLKYIRFVFTAEDMINTIPLVTFAELGNDGPIFYHRLITPVARFTDFSITEAINTGTVTTYVLKFHKTNYETEFGITDSTLIWQNNPISNIEVVIPSRRKTQAWNFQIRKASEILGNTFVSTVNLLGSRPLIVTEEVPSRITPGVLKLSQKDVSVKSDGIIADLATDWTVGIHLTINGEDKTNTIIDVNEETGYVLLNQPVASSSSIIVNYAVDTTKWVEFSLDLNPRIERKSLRPPWMTFDVDDSNYSLYISKGTVSPSFFIGPSARLNRLYPFQGDLEDPTTAAEYIIRRPNHISIATLGVQSTKSPAIIDVRKLGGGLKETLKRETNFDLKSHVSLGFYDGQPIQENIIIIKMPIEIYRSIYNRYIETDTNSQLTQQDTFTNSSTLKLTQTPYFSYVGFDWLNGKWDTQPITISVTDSDGTYDALDLTNYKNLAEVPVLETYTSTLQYLFYYYRGKIYLNTSTYTSILATYKYVVTEVFNQDAHIAASDYIDNALKSLIAEGTYYILQDTDGNLYPVTMNRA